MRKVLRNGSGSWTQRTTGSGNCEKPRGLHVLLRTDTKLTINSLGCLELCKRFLSRVEVVPEGTVIISMDGTYLCLKALCVFEDLETGEIAGLGGEPLVVELEPQTTYTDRFVITVL